MAIADAEEDLWSETMRTTAGRGGGFDFRNLRPGDYYVFAVDRNDPAAMSTPAFRRAVLPRAEKVHLEKGGAVVLNLKIIPWPE